MQPEPSRPKSGDSMQALSAGQAGSGESFVASAMPPTLFCLPNLKKADLHSERSGSDNNHPDSPRSGPPIPPAIPTSVETPANKTRDPQRGSTPTPPQLDNPGSYGADIPAGRSWMDSVRSHGVVVVLLLVFVVAAVVTSRNTDPSQTEASVVDGGEFIVDVDQGIAATTARQSQPDRIESEFVAPETTLSPPTMSSSEVVEHPLGTATNLNGPAVSPVETHPNVATQSNLARPSNVALQSSMMQSPDSAAHDYSTSTHRGTEAAIDAQVVSTRLRTTMDQSRDQQPTLDELAESLPSGRDASQQNHDPEARAERAMTNTPMWTNDLGQFLPELPTQSQ